MTPMFKPTTLALALVSAVALSGCPKQEHSDQPAADANVTTATPAPAKLKVDESTLPPANHFAITDLDASKNACADFGGYVNGKWLASNEIPGDRSSWGAFDRKYSRKPERISLDFIAMILLQGKNARAPVGRRTTIYGARPRAISFPALPR